MGHGTVMAHIDRLSLVDATALIVTLVVASRSSGTHVSRFSKAQPSLHLSNPTWDLTVPTGLRWRSSFTGVHMKTIVIVALVAGSIYGVLARVTEASATNIVTNAASARDAAIEAATK